MADRLNKFAHRITDDASNIVHGFHGAGEAIRGTANSTMDGLVPNHESKEGGGRARDDAVAQKGLDELHGAEAHFGHRHDGSASGGFTHGSGKGYSLRGGAGTAEAGEHNHKNTGAAAGGQGTALGKGTLRADERTGYEGRLGHGQGNDTQGGQSGVGLGAAKLAWDGGQQRQKQPEPPKQAGAHSAAPGSLESNPFPVEDIGGEGQPRREGF
jgi:hypothetical protein